MAGTLIVAESVDGAVASYSNELITAARQLDAGDVTAFVAGEESLSAGANATSVIIVSVATLILAVLLGGGTFVLLRSGSGDRT